ncbi:MAG: hypothetical protein LBE62_11035 [Azonexus sp.]|jgi:hypothetical protein|nr:hypothetical protein [Azonexus sp.]
MSISQFISDIEFVKLGARTESRSLYDAFRALLEPFSNTAPIKEITPISIAPRSLLDYWQNSPVFQNPLILMRHTFGDHDFGFLFEKSCFLFSTPPLMRLRVEFMCPAKGPGSLRLILSDPDGSHDILADIKMSPCDQSALALVEASSKACDLLNWKLSYSSASDI